MSSSPSSVMNRIEPIAAYVNSKMMTPANKRNRKYLCKQNWIGVNIWFPTKNCTTVKLSANKAYRFLEFNANFKMLIDNKLNHFELAIIGIPASIDWYPQNVFITAIIQMFSYAFEIESIACIHGIVQMKICPFLLCEITSNASET